MHVPPLLLLALPAQAGWAALPLTHVGWSACVGFCFAAPAVFAGLNCARVQT